ncbi:tricarballylate utilization 4Fe-4S protein TcuB [Thermodesulfobium sp. 4217-1]|uniref:tricarballylate utilization 4Fe-4S protein TcuB n=1 Tax=Thermodesulfobium sp. 4217-1 TaxID=3120013 RepID=UPI003221AAD6
MFDKNFEDARFSLNICNACRYCENICPVFKAIELRRTFSDNDIIYLANLCHDCRGCYYACQYAPPHTFDINIPKVFGTLRLETYKNYRNSKFSKDIVDKPHLYSIATFIVSFLFYTISSIIYTGKLSLIVIVDQNASFYSILPENFLIITMLIPFAISLTIYIKNFIDYCDYIGIKKGDFLKLSSHIRSLKSVILLEFLGGGGFGCNYPDEEYSFSRRIYHQFVLFGFKITFISTLIAAFMSHILNISPPYTFTSLPVIFGSIGGALLLLGLTGLLYLRTKMDRIPYSENVNSMDINFIMILLLSVLTGFLVLLFRSTIFMPILLIIHLSIVITFFIMLPFSKLQHAVFRYVSIYKYFSEMNK